jgi:uncharacterized membrane protein
MRSLTEEQPIPAGGNATPSAGRSRLDSIDILRGLIMVIMALDHTRGYFNNSQVDPVDLDKTDAALFLTRWITHYCAPTFVFLAGTGAYLAGSRMTRKELSWFLLSRGLWLILVDLTLVHYGWTFDFSFAQQLPNGRTIYVIGGGIVWAIGSAMVILSALCFLPTAAVTAIGVAIGAFHNLFDAKLIENMGLFTHWGYLHSGERVQFTDRIFFFSPYGLLPWTGVMACGYGLGALMLLPRAVRRPRLIVLGLTLILLFIGLRYTNFYGDKAFAAQANTPGPWSIRNEPGTGEPSWLFTLLSFMNCQKYPPSLLFTLMTLGPGILLLGIWDRPPGPVGRFFVTYGRVPLFYYVLHIFLIHSLHDLAGNIMRTDNYRCSLLQVYALWIGVVLTLYWPCYWFAGVKSRNKSAWLSYL